MKIRFPSRTASIRLLAAAFAVVIPAANAADAFPCQVLTIVSPYPAGGTTDILAPADRAGAGQGPGRTGDRRQQGGCQQQHRHRGSHPLVA